jgi:hypothetical protein
MPECFLSVSVELVRFTAHFATFIPLFYFHLSGFRLVERSSSWIPLRRLGSFASLVLFTTGGHTLARYCVQLQIFFKILRRFNSLSHPVRQRLLLLPIFVHSWDHKSNQSSTEYTLNRGVFAALPPNQ